MDSSMLQNLQGVEFSILCMIDDYCRQKNIHYSLYAGTALGAVRHSGFIPWDDDVDIAMTRSEFDQFCKEWRRDPVPGYYLESILTDDHCGICHAKIRKDKTQIIFKGDIEGNDHNGIWVDIFPLDKVSIDPQFRAKKEKIGREIVFLSRANDRSPSDSLKKELTKKIFRLIPHKIRMRRVRYLHSWLVNHAEDGVDKGFNWKSMSTLKNISEINFSPQLDSGYCLIEFNGRRFPIYENYDSMLKDTFGDYMKLPPESERICKHKPIKILI